MENKKWPASKITMRKTAELTPYANNSRMHSAKQIDQIAASINEWGFTNPVLIDEKGMIIAGHGRVMAAQKLNLEEVPTITATGWTEAQKKAYVIADNKLGDISQFDDEALKLEIEALGELNFDLNKLGFEGFELSNIFDDGVRDEVAPDSFGEVEEFDMQHQCPKCGFEFN